MLDRPYVEIECKNCHVIDIIYMIAEPGTQVLDLHGWSSCPNSCCWLCDKCEGKHPSINVKKVIISLY